MIESKYKTRFELIQIEKNYRKDRSIFIKDRTLFLVGRLNDKVKKIFFVNDFFPRFYVETEENIEHILKDKEVKKKIKEIKTRKDGKEFDYRNLGGTKEMLTIYTYRTADVVDIRDYFTKTYEANIKFTEVFKRAKGIRDAFYVPTYIISLKTRIFKIQGLEYVMAKESEIDGGNLTFD